MADLVDAELLALLRCPVSGKPLRISGDKLVTDEGHAYNVVQGIPCMIAPTLEPTHSGYVALMEEAPTNDLSMDVDHFIDNMIVPTCGNLYHGVKLRGRYPIPDMPEELPNGLILDVGCNWGRWSIGASSKQRQVVGVDIDFGGLLVAKELARRLAPESRPYFVQADARSLPFAPGVFDGVLSYSVIQHFSKANAALVLGQVARVMKSGATAVVQMPNKAGLKARLTLARRKDPEGKAFDVRYYSVDELVSLFGRTIGPARWRVDCFFGLNVHARDREFVQASKRWIVDLATFLLKLSNRIRPLGRMSDSVFVAATKT